jgi:sugar phosphate isomerase/epimerase
MKLEFFRTLWGHTGPLRPLAQAAKLAGYTGLEGPFPKTPEAQKEFRDALAEFNLDYIGEISTTGFAVPEPGSTVQQHLEAFTQIIERTLRANPRFFTAMAGSDLWSFQESVEFLHRAHEIAQNSGVRVGFETHRSRSLFHPRITRELLQEVPPIELTLDFSHWCNVCERLVLDEMPDVLSLCAARALHIQARVGYDQGAQVPDPSQPRYSPALSAHLRWWQVVVDNQRERGFSSATFTPEFGPDGYQQIDPRTNSPVGDLAEFNLWMVGTLRHHFR